MVAAILLGLSLPLVAAWPQDPPTTTVAAVATQASEVTPADLQGPRLAGKALRKAVRQIAALPWHADLEDAIAAAAASGKPILWLQALGDLEGFA